MVLDARTEGRTVNDDEDQDVTQDAGSRGVDVLTAATQEAKLAGKPHLMYEGTFRLFADPQGALVLVVETPGQDKPSVKVFSRRMVRMVSKMMPGFGG